MEARVKPIFSNRQILYFCLICAAVLPLALFSSTGYGQSYTSYWAAYSLAEFGELLNHNGERLEISSSLLHVLLLALLHKLTSLPLSLLGGLLGIIFAALTVLKTYQLGNLLNPAAGRTAALLVALNPVFLYWAASGTEATLLSWLIVWAVFALVQLVTVGLSASALLRATLPLTAIQLLRPEGSVFVLGALAICALFSGYGNAGREPDQNTLSRRSLLWLVVLAAAVAVALLTWRFVYFGQWAPQASVAKALGPDISVNGLWAEYRYFIQAIAIRSGYGLYLLLFGMASIWALVKIIRLPRAQSPALWLSALFCWFYLCCIFVSGGDWVIGQNGEWLVSMRILSHVAPLMALLLAVALNALNSRWLHYSAAVVLGLSLLLPAVRLAESESMGLPVHVGIKYAEQIGQQPQARSMSWFDLTNRLHMRDITLTTSLDETITTLHSSLDRPVRLLSRQPGMALYYLTKTHYGNIQVYDRRGFIDTALLNCAPSEQLQHRTIGLNLTYSRLFENWQAYAECIERPDIIFDLLIHPLEMQALRNNGYTIVYEQNGYQDVGENRVQQHAFYAVSSELVPLLTLPAQQLNLNHQFWRKEDARLYDPEQNMRFVVIGHGRGLLEGHTDVLEQLTEAINLQQPQYVFVLGDFVRLSSDEEWDQLYEHLFDRLDAPFIFVPGNHETRSNANGDDSVYRRRMEPFPDVIKTPHVNFVFFDSSLHLPQVEKKLTEAFARVDTDKPTILVTHHAVWAVGVPPSRHVPTFSSQQFLPLIDGLTETIISGDGSARFKVDSLPGGITAYQTGIGMKGRYDPLYFSIGNIGTDGELDLQPFEVSINPYHDWYRVLEPQPTLPYLLKNAPPIGAD